jgi:hypothetical protein
VSHTSSNACGVPQARTTPKSSMLSAPHHIPAIVVADAFPPGWSVVFGLLNLIADLRIRSR